MADHDPTPAEIEAGARVLDQWEHYVAADSAHVAELVLRAVLPDHDARIRAKIAEEIAREIEAAADAYNARIAQAAGVPMRVHDGMVSHGIRRAAVIARQHALTGEDTT